MALCSNLGTRDELIEALRGSLVEAGELSVVQFEPAAFDPLAEVLRQAGSPPPGPVMVVGLERTLEAGHGPAVLDLMNLQRPRWAESVPRTVVFWIPDRYAGELLRGAPDFWDCENKGFDDVSVRPGTTIV